MGVFRQPVWYNKPCLSAGSWEEAIRKHLTRGLQDLISASMGFYAVTIPAHHLLYMVACNFIILGMHMCNSCWQNFSDAIIVK